MRSEAELKQMDKKLSFINDYIYNNDYIIRIKIILVY